MRIHVDQTTETMRKSSLQRVFIVFHTNNGVGLHLPSLQTTAGLEEFWHFATFTRLVLDETREQLMDGLSRECNPTYSQLLEKIINLGESLTKLEMTYETLEIRIISQDSPALNAFSSEWRELFQTLNQFSDTMKHYPEFYEWQPLPPHIIY